MLDDDGVADIKGLKNCFKLETYLLIRQVCLSNVFFLTSVSKVVVQEFSRLSLVSSGIPIEACQQVHVSKYHVLKGTCASLCFSVQE